MARKPTVKETTTKKETKKKATPTVERNLRERKEKEPVAEIVPKKTAAKKKTAKKTKSRKSKALRSTKPTYESMIIEAIRELGGRSGCGYGSISKFIESNYPVPENFKRYLSSALKKAVENEDVEMNVRRYKLGANTKTPEVARRRSTRSTTGSTRSSSPASRSKTTSAKESPSKRKKPAQKEKETTTKRASRSSTKETSSPKKTTKKAATAKASKSGKGSPKKRDKKSSKEEEDESTSETSESSKSSKSVGVTKPPGLKYDYIWQYHDGSWKNYQTASSDVCEEVYQKYLLNKGETDVRAVKSGQWEYMVDFVAMKQTNIQHEQHTVRDIRRIKCV